jgi:hypothetical protein
MKRIIRCFSALAAVSLVFYGCKKSTEDILPDNPTTVATAPGNLHGMGLNPMQPSDWASVPAFNANLFNGDMQIDSLAHTDGLSHAGALPGSYLLTTPQIRDQGQIGACTGFCGAEADEILYYYKKHTPARISNFTMANGLKLAVQNEIPNTSEAAAYGPGNSTSAAFSPLFLYFVERVVINGNSIGSDPGAYMVNIGQALQGLSSNSGTGMALKYSNYTFDGIPVEGNYKYPFVSGSGGYNVATPSKTPYSVYPYTYYYYGSTIIPTAPNNYPIGKQRGSTGSSGITTEGYYVINDTRKALVNDVKIALVNNKPVMMGFNIYDAAPGYPYFENLNTARYTYNPLTSKGSLQSGASFMGGHAVPIVGYIDDRSQPGGGVFICQNSWGTPWGYHGYFYLPYSVIQNTTIVPAGNLYVAIL